MIKEIRELINNVQRRDLTSYTKKVLYTFLSDEREWLPLSTFRVPNPGSRVRDLRKLGFDVECRNAREIGRSGDVFYYRLDRKGLRVGRVREILE